MILKRSVPSRQQMPKALSTKNGMVTKGEKLEGGGGKGTQEEHVWMRKK